MDHLRDDLEELRKLFFQAKVPMQVCLCVFGGGWVAAALVKFVMRLYSFG